MQVTFNLDYYFKRTNVYYALFDGLFNSLEKDKLTILEELGIGSSSYRNQRATANVSNKSNILLLLDFFGYEMNNSLEKQEKYEILLTKIDYSCYYKQLNKIETLLKELEPELSKNTPMKPLLCLFRAFLISNLEYQYSIAKEILDSDLKYLSYFYNKNYFVNEFEFIYLILMNYYDVFTFSIDTLTDNLSLKYPKYLWLYYFTKASKAYKNKNDAVALVNYELAANEFRKNNNFERFLMAVTNASGIYNILGEYTSCLNLCSPCVEYIFCTDGNLLRCKKILMHYLFANLMLKRYKEIIDFISILVFV